MRPQSINDLRRQVSELHAAARPDFFKAGFPDVLRDHIHDFMSADNCCILVAENDSSLVGFACIEVVEVPDRPHRPARQYVEVHELGVDAAARHQGIGRAIMDGVADFARARSIDRIELNMWEFNENALHFYEALGFRTYRRYMEYSID